MLTRVCMVAAVLALLVLGPAGARGQCARAVNLAWQAQGCSVRLTWDNTPGAPPPALGWAIFRRAFGPDLGMTPIDTVLPGTTVYTDTTAAPGTLYRYFVRAQVAPGTCAGADLDSAELFVRTADGAVLSVPQTSCDSVIMEWGAVVGAVSYELRRRAGGTTDTFVTIGTFPPTVTTYTDSQVVPGRAYEYRLRTHTVCGTVTNETDLRVAVPLRPSASRDVESVARNRGETVLWMFDIAFGPDTPNLEVRRDGVLVSPGGRVTFGSSNLSMTISNLREEDSGVYTFTFSNQCGSVTLDAVLLVRPSGCRADFDRSGGPPSVQDVFAFLEAWFAGCP